MEKRIKCPHCGAVLKVVAKAGFENKPLKCPVCSEVSLFKEYKEIIQKTDETMLPNQDNDSTSLQAGKAQQKTINTMIGSIKVLGAKEELYKLKEGKNVIGRMSSSSNADIQIKADNHLSREHIIIDVKNIPGMGKVHYLSLHKEKVNATFVNDERLMFGDSIVLQNGDRIKLPASITIAFELIDSDETNYVS